jgi:hypothetical protein
MKARLVLLAAVAMAFQLAGCGGGSSSSAPTASAASVTGIATPKTVSVVTAN